MHRGQVSVEYIVVLGFLLVAVSAIFVISTTTSQQAIANSKTNEAVETLSSAVNQVYKLGPGNKLKASIDLPQNIYNTIIEDDTIGFQAGSQDNLSDYFQIVDANLLATELPLNAGKHYVSVEMQDNGYVRIGKGLRAVPSSLELTLPPVSGMNSVTEEIILENETSSSISGITYSLRDDLNAENTSLSSTFSSLSPDSNNSFNAEFTIPVDSMTSTITGYIDYNSLFTDSTLVTIFIPQISDSVSVSIYSDSGYSLPSSDFNQGDLLYYSIQVTDQNSESLETNDLNIAIKDPSSSDVNSFTNVFASSGIYKGTFLIPGDADTGEWNVVADANVYNSVSDTSSFTVSESEEPEPEPDQSDSFSFDSSSVSYNSGPDRLQGLTISNTGDGEIRVVDMNVMVFDDSDDAEVDKIRINSSNVFTSGTVSTGVWIDDYASLSDFNISSGDTHNINYIDFDDAVNNDSETIQLQFEFSDGSVYTTELFTVAEEGGGGGSDQSDSFSFDSSSVSYNSGKDRLRGLTISNTGGEDITVVDMKISVFDDSDNAEVDKIRIDSSNVFSSGKVSTGVWIDDVSTLSDFTVSSGDTDSINYIDFDDDIDDEGETVQIQFEFSDGSIYTTNTFSVP